MPAETAQNPKISHNQGNQWLCSPESPLDEKMSVTEVYEAMMKSIYSMNRLVGWYDLRGLLEPKHLYFQDKKGYLDGFRVYQPEDKDIYFLYPVVIGADGKHLPKNNCFRKFQLAQSHTARKVKMITQVIDKFKLKDFKSIFLTLTMPKKLSEYLASIGDKGFEHAWNMYKKYWQWHNDRFGSGLAASVNLHTWKSEKPIEPHFHFHSLIPNYKLVITNELADDGEAGFTFEKMTWHKQKSGTEVPYSESELLEIKAAWWQIMTKYSKRHNVFWNATKKQIDIFVEFADAEKEPWKLQHHFNYQGRYPLKDYALYSNKHIDCINPPAFIEKYQNHARKFGWWNIMAKIAGKIPDDKVKINPMDNKPMKYIGKISLHRLLHMGRLGFLEIVRGVPKFSKLDLKEISWLAGVQQNLISWNDLFYTLEMPVPGAPEWYQINFNEREEKNYG